MENEALEKLGDLVQERKGIERKLSTTYSLGRDTTSSVSKSLLPLHEGKARSYSFQGAKKESVTIFHTLSDTSSRESSSSSSDGETSWSFLEDELANREKGKAKVEEAINEAESSSTDGDGGFRRDFCRSPSEPAASSSRGTVNPLLGEQAWRDCELNDVEGEVESVKKNSSRSLSLKRRRALSSTN